jgi:hypothetical protein
MSEILVPISPGELLDKITILRIKSRRIGDADKLVNVRRELALLERTWQQSIEGRSALAGELVADREALEQVNGALWDIEDRIRGHEAERRFDAAFIELARAVYLHNDERAAIKKRINLRLNASIQEEKSYRPYAAGPADPKP